MDDHQRDAGLPGLADRDPFGRELAIAWSDGAVQVGGTFKTATLEAVFLQLTGKELRE